MPPRTVKPKEGETRASAPVDAHAEMNLTVLRASDASIESIVAQSKHCVLYGFDVNSRSWVRKSVEGALFVVRRSSAPRDAFVVLNRAGSENFTREIGGEAFELERSPPYLMYRVGREVHGIWFHDESECETMCEAFERVMSGSSVGSASAGGSIDERATSDSLSALFASASVSGGENPKRDVKASVVNGSNGTTVPRVLQPPRKVMGTSTEAPRATRSKSASVATTAMAVVKPAAVRAALLELIEDDTFIDRITKAIARHS